MKASHQPERPLYYPSHLPKMTYPWVTPKNPLPMRLPWWGPGGWELRRTDVQSKLGRIFSRSLHWGVEVELLWMINGLCMTETLCPDLGGTGLPGPPKPSLNVHVGISGSSVLVGAEGISLTDFPRWFCGCCPNQPIRGVLEPHTLGFQGIALTFCKIFNNFQN